MGASSSIPSANQAPATAAPAPGQAEVNLAAFGLLPLVGGPHLLASPVLLLALLENQRMLEHQRMLEILQCQRILEYQRELERQTQRQILEELVKNHVRQSATSPIEEKPSVVERGSTPTSTKRKEAAASTSVIVEQRQQKRRRAETPVSARGSSASQHSSLTPHTPSPMPANSSDAKRSTPSPLETGRHNASPTSAVLNIRIQKYLKKMKTSGIDPENDYKLYKNLRKRLEKEKIADTKTCEEMIKHMIRFLKERYNNLLKNEKDTYVKLIAQAKRLDEKLADYHEDYALEQTLAIKKKATAVAASASNNVEEIKSETRSHASSKDQFETINPKDRRKINSCIDLEIHNYTEIITELRKEGKLETSSQTLFNRLINLFEESISSDNSDKSNKNKMKYMIYTLIQRLKIILDDKNTKSREDYLHIFSEAEELDKKWLTYWDQHLIKKRLDIFIQHKVYLQLKLISQGIDVNRGALYKEFRDQLVYEEVIDPKTCEEMIKYMINYIKIRCDEISKNSKLKNKDRYDKLKAQADLLMVYHEKYVKDPRLVIEEKPLVVGVELTPTATEQRSGFAATTSCDSDNKREPQGIRGDDPLLPTRDSKDSSAIERSSLPPYTPSSMPAESSDSKRSAPSPSESERNANLPTTITPTLSGKGVHSLSSSTTLSVELMKKIEKYAKKRFTEQRGLIKEGKGCESKYKMYREFRKKFKREKAADTKTCEEMIKHFIHCIKMSCNKYIKKGSGRNIYKILHDQVDLLGKELAAHEKKYQVENSEDMRKINEYIDKKVRNIPNIAKKNGNRNSEISSASLFKVLMSWFKRNVSTDYKDEFKMKYMVELLIEKLTKAKERGGADTKAYDLILSLAIKLSPKLGEYWKGNYGEVEEPAETVSASTAEPIDHATSESSVPAFVLPAQVALPAIVLDGNPDFHQTSPAEEADLWSLGHTGLNFADEDFVSILLLSETGFGFNPAATLEAEHKLVASVHALPPELADFADDGDWAPASLSCSEEPVDFNRVTSGGVELNLDDALPASPALYAADGVGGGMPALFPSSSTDALGGMRARSYSPTFFAVNHQSSLDPLTGVKEGSLHSSSLFAFNQSLLPSLPPLPSLDP